jgi:hypothetical protein
VEEVSHGRKKHAARVRAYASCRKECVDRSGLAWDGWRNPVAGSRRHTWPVVVLGRLGIAAGGRHAGQCGEPGWWQAPSDQISGGLLHGGLRQLTAMQEKDPILRAIEDGLNVNPLHDVIPVDWAEIVRALRSIWLLKMSRPGKAA